MKNNYNIQSIISYTTHIMISVDDSGITSLQESNVYLNLIDLYNKYREYRMDKMFDRCTQTMTKARNNLKNEYFALLTGIDHIKYNKDPHIQKQVALIQKEIRYVFQSWSRLKIYYQYAYCNTLINILSKPQVVEAATDCGISGLISSFVDAFNLYRDTWSKVDKEKTRRKDNPTATELKPKIWEAIGNLTKYVHINAINNQDPQWIKMAGLLALHKQEFLKESKRKRKTSRENAETDTETGITETGPLLSPENMP